MDSNQALVGLTAVLVAITGFYAWQNRAMVSEMRRSRELSVLPKLSISIFMLGPTYGVARLVNAGMGPALDVDLTIAFHRRDGGTPVERRWRQSLMSPGEGHEFIEPDEFGEVTSTEVLAQLCSEITVEGTIRSSLSEVI